MAVGFVLITTHPGAEVSVREAVSKIEHVSGQWSSVFAGRTGTRVFPGVVHKRWHDGVDMALDF